MVLQRIKSVFPLRLARNYSMDMLKLHERGMYKDMFPNIAVNEVKHLFSQGPQTVYAGFDPTASSLHVGNLLVLLNLLHWQRAGHCVITVIGGATGCIGDPSGRTTDRPFLDRQTLDQNILGIRNNINNIFENHSKYMWKNKTELKPAKILNNYDFYKGMSAIDFVSKVGRHFRMGTMLLKDSVNTKIKSDSGMSFTEFTYQIFQAFDWLYLLQTYDCKFQLGGSDQMGNISAGHELISRVEKKSVYGLTLPLVTSEEGDKFGKSSGNAVWLDAEKTSPFTMYQFFMRTKDTEVEKLLNLFTFYTAGEIKVLMTRHRNKPELRVPQTILAKDVTLLVHGEEGLKKAETATNTLFSNNVESLIGLSAADVESIFEGATVVDLAMETGMDILTLSMRAGCFPTESDALRIIGAGGFRINHQKTLNPLEMITQSAHILPNKLSLLRVGKKTYYIVRWTNY